jgi:PAS domain S-box-containing protein
MTDTRVRLLLIDDVEDDYLLIRDLLATIEGMSHTLDWVDSYDAARAAIARRAHDVYLVDYRFGAENGLDLVREIAGGIAPLPIILVTGHGDRRVDIEAMEAGATGYLVKGEITPAALERAVRYALRHTRANVALHESEDRFRTFIEAMSVGAVLTGPQGQLIMTNQAAEEILGRSAEQLAGKPALDPAWDAIAEDGSSVPPEALPPFTVLQTGEAVRDVILGIMRPARGGRVWVQVSAVPRYGHDGTLLGVISTFTDITARRQAEAALRASEARFRSMYENAPIGMALLDIHGRILLANPALQRILDYAEEALCRMTFADITHPDDVASDWALFAELVAGTRDSYTLVKRYLRRDGHLVWGHLAVSASRDPNGAPQSIIGMLQDITERQQTERAMEQARAAAEELAAVHQHQAEEAEAMAAVGAALAATLDPAAVYRVILE